VRQATDGTRKSLPTIVAELLDDLGAEATALIAGVSDPQLVRQWSTGAAVPAADVEQRLRIAWTVAELLASAEPRRGLRIWFLGANPHLGGVPPAIAVRTDPRGVLAAAHTFIAHG
jgi:hypothetical protein